MSVHPKRGLFLDLDGTLADSLAAMHYVYEQFLQEQACAGSAAEFSSLNGPSLPEIVAVLKRRHRLEGSIPVLLERYEQLVRDAYENVSAMSGARGLMAVAESRGWKIAIVTSNRSAIAQRWLEKSALMKYVTAVVGQEMVSQAKPAPELYLHALALSDCAAGCSIAVEDSMAGAQAALGAGLRTYLVGAQRNAPGGNRLGYVEDLNVLARQFADDTIALQPQAM